jgi:LytS/YehU family sensor histidine kinase
LHEEKRGQRIIIGISIGALLIAMVLLIFVLRTNRLQKKLFVKEKEVQKNELEKRMFELEQTALRAQMNPHFIFNSLNSVQRFVINNDAEGVNQCLSTFANLIRQTLENSGKQLIPLKDEVRYLETYLRLEQMRGSGRFTYNINVNPDVDSEETYIPNMIIQPYLENSVIHGMAGKKGNEGIINLTISKNHKLTCVVEDNGIGISQSRAQKKAMADEYESMGTAITEKRIEMFNIMHKEKIELQVLDKSEQGDAESGTKIMIKFPLNSNN